MTDLELEDIRGRAEHVPASAWQNAPGASDDELGPILAFVRRARADVLKLVDEIKRLRDACDTMARLWRDKGLPLPSEFEEFGK